MTPESAQRLSAWRVQLDAELQEAIAAVPQLEADHAGAIAAVGAAESAHRDLQVALAEAFERLTAPLALRLSWLRSEVDDARGHVARCNGSLKAARGKVDELRRAVRQLDHVIPAEEAQEAA